MLIHLSRCNPALFQALPEHFVRLVPRAGHWLAEALHVDPAASILPHLQVAIVGPQKVCDLLLVDLQEGTTANHLVIVCCVKFDLSEDEVEQPTAQASPWLCAKRLS
jgi:hypothetical protein